MNWVRWLWFLIHLLQCRHLLQRWRCSQSMNLPEEHGQYWKNYWKKLILPPSTPSDSLSPPSFHTPSFISIYLHITLGFQVFQQDFIGLIWDWMHPDDLTGDSPHTAHQVDASKKVCYKYRGAESLPVAGGWEGLGKGFVSSVALSDPIPCY